MKTRMGFISNSSSTSFIVDVNSEYFKRLKTEDDFHYKSGYDLDRCTGVYDKKNIKIWINEIEKYLSSDIIEKFSSLLYDENNIAMVMISDEQMGGTLPHPNKTDILFEMEWP